MKTIYQVRHSFNYKDESTGKETYFTRANEHTLEATVADLEPYIAAGSVVKIDAPDDYRAPGEAPEEGDEGQPMALAQEPGEMLEGDEETPAASRKRRKR